MQKVMLITGCSSGFGKEFVLQAAKRVLCDSSYQYHVIATARKPSDLEYCKNLANVTSLKLDITDHNEIKNVVNYINDKFGHLDILINNAGVGYYSSFEEINEQSLQHTLNVNVLGPIFMIKNSIFLLKKSITNAVIINISSEAGYFPNENAPAYSISKYALEGVSSNIRIYLKRKKLPINVITVNPGPYQTNFRYKALHAGNNLPSDINSPLPDKAVNSILDQLNKEKLPTRIVCGQDAIEKLKFTTKLYEEDIAFSSANFLNM